jgi:carbamoyltransferase
MYILGINAYHGDASACILKDGIVIVATEEERFRRIKHWAGFPSESIKFCFTESGINLHDLDYITVSRDPKANFFRKLKYTLTHIKSIRHSIDRFSNTRKVMSIKKDLANLFNISENKFNRKLINVEHHKSHIASSFFASDFKDSAVLSIDGFGDFSSTMIGYGSGNKLTITKSINYPHSLGILYTAATQFLGFSNYGDEYKVMGLSSYGKPNFLNDFRKLISFTNDGLFKLSKKYFKHFDSGVDMNWKSGFPVIQNLYNDNWQKLFFKSRIKSEKITQDHMDFAASAQAITEEVIFHILNRLHLDTKIDNLCISGGVAQNSVINGKILSNTGFKNLYIPPAAHDAGTSIGSALYLHNHILNNERSALQDNAYFGSRFTNKEIISILKQRSILYTQLDDPQLILKVTNKIIKGGVVGWFQGRAEFGPRALGHRSILVDPRRKDAQELLNKKIKRRESFRPFAPSILEDHVDDYFKQNDRSPFMEKVFLIKEDKRELIPAVTHVDGTGRLQTVNTNSSPRYFRLIKSFHQKTGIPMLLNTSFNENEPIVNHPEEALDCFLRTKMDMLVMENIIIER